VTRKREKRAKGRRHGHVQQEKGKHLSKREQWEIRERRGKPRSRSTANCYTEEWGRTNREKRGGYQGTDRGIKRPGIHLKATRITKKNCCTGGRRGKGNEEEKKLKDPRTINPKKRKRIKKGRGWGDGRGIYRELKPKTNQRKRKGGKKNRRGEVKLQRGVQ